MHLITTALVCAVRQHGEHGVIARLMTAEAGLLAGYVRGGRSTRMRPILIPGNAVAAEFRARGEDQLASLTVEMAHSRAGLLGEPLAAAAVDWVTALTATALPEGQPYPAVHSALDGLLTAIELGGVARAWAVAIVRYETLLLAHLGYGDDLQPTSDLFRALGRNREALTDHVIGGPRGAGLLAVRERLVERLHRAIA
jgi:DNA repair protein RecO (recombination protein O)